MKQLNETLYPLNEAHVNVLCDVMDVTVEDMPEGFVLPESYQVGLRMIFLLLEKMLPTLTCISVSGIWFQGRQPDFCAFDLWAQVGPEDGFFLPMTTAQSLFSNNGIPYFHLPIWQ